MNQRTQGSQFKFPIWILVLAGLLLLPAVFYYGIAGVLTLVFGALSLQHLVAAFRSQTDVCWGAGMMTRFRMSRLSRFILGLWFAYIAAYVVIRMILKLPGSPYYFTGHGAFMVLVIVTRWMDTGRFKI